MIVEPRLNDVREDAANGIAKGVVVFSEQRAVGGVDHQVTSFELAKFTIFMEAGTILVKFVSLVGAAVMLTEQRATIRRG
jgi:hypothetical protein